MRTRDPLLGKEVRYHCATSARALLIEIISSPSSSSRQRALEALELRRRDRPTPSDPLATQASFAEPAPDQLRMPRQLLRDLIHRQPFHIHSDLKLVVRCYLLLIRVLTRKARPMIMCHVEAGAGR
jgi:hypothetical protein